MKDGGKGAKRDRGSREKDTKRKGHNEIVVHFNPIKASLNET